MASGILTVTPTVTARAGRIIPGPTPGRAVTGILRTVSIHFTGLIRFTLLSARAYSFPILLISEVHGAGVQDGEVCMTPSTTLSTDLTPTDGATRTMDSIVHGGITPIIPAGAMTLTTATDGEILTTHTRTFMLTTCITAGP